MLISPLAHVLSGIALGLQYNPVVSVAGAALAAAISGYPAAPRSRWAWSAAILLVAWLAGDGIPVLAAAAAATSAGAAATTVAWAITGVAFGLFLPAALGAYVGRRVTHGTGWLSALVVAATVAGALTWIAPHLAAAVHAAALL